MTYELREQFRITKTEGNGCEHHAQRLLQNALCPLTWRRSFHSRVKIPVVGYVARDFWVAASAPGSETGSWVGGV